MASIECWLRWSWPVAVLVSSCTGRSQAHHGPKMQHPNWSNTRRPSFRRCSLRCSCCLILTRCSTPFLDADDWLDQLPPLTPSIPCNNSYFEKRSLLCQVSLHVLSEVTLLLDHLHEVPWQLLQLIIILLAIPTRNFNAIVDLPFEVVTHVVYDDHSVEWSAEPLQILNCFVRLHPCRMVSKQFVWDALFFVNKI